MAKKRDAQGHFVSDDKAEEPKLVGDPVETGEYPAFEGDAKQDYVDINDPKHANMTYAELQALANK